MITTILIALMLQGEPQKPQPQKDTTTTTTTQNGTVRNGKVVIRIPIIKTIIFI